MANSNKPIRPRGTMQYTGKRNYKGNKPIRQRPDANARFVPNIKRQITPQKENIMTNKSTSIPNGVDITPPDMNDPSRPEELHDMYTPKQEAEVAARDTKLTTEGYEEKSAQHTDKKVESSIADEEDQTIQELKNIDWTNIERAESTTTEVEPPYTTEELELLEAEDVEMERYNDAIKAEQEKQKEEIPEYKKDKEGNDSYTLPPFKEDKYKIAKRIADDKGNPALSLILDKWDKANQVIEEAYFNHDGAKVNEIASRTGVITYSGYKEPFVKELRDIADNMVRSINKTFKGEVPIEAIDAIVGNTLGMNGRATVWLPILGVEVVITAPAPITYTTFWHQLDQLMSRENISTYGVSYAIQVAPYADAIAELAINHIAKISIDAPIEEVVNKDNLTLPDLEILLMGLMAARYTSGYEIDVSCIECSKEDKFNINLINTIKYKDIPELYEHDCFKLRRNDTKVNIDTWKDYRELVTKLMYTEYKLSDKITVIWQLPSINQYTITAGKQVQHIKNAADSIVIEDVEIDNDIINMINSTLAISYMANHTTKIIIKQPPNDEEAILVKPEAIIKAYEALNESETIPAKAIKAAANWAGDSLAAAVIPKYKCTACMRDEKATEDNPVAYIPIDVMNFFGLAMKQRFMAS